MSSFLDSGDSSTAGTGLMVDGVESNRATVSPSAVQEIHINEDPYSAQYYRPGRGQIEIITKPVSDRYHGEFNFLFRDSALNAQNAFAPSKPFEQRRIYEGNVTGPLLHSQKTGFLVSFNRSEEDLNAVVNATVPATTANPQGILNENVPTPTRDTEFSVRVGHKFSDTNNGYVTYAYQDSTNTNENVGNQTLAEAGVNTEYREDDLIFHDDLILSPTKLNQASLVLERVSNPTTDVAEAPAINVQGNFTGGSAQADQQHTEYNARLSDIVSWTSGPHSFKFGVNVPHFSRRVFEDHTNQGGSYTFSPTYAADGVTVIATALQNYQNNIPSGFSIAQGQTRFVYHQQEVGGFFQDQIKLRQNFSLTPGLRYDWQKFLGGDRNNFSPRISFGYVLDQKSKTVLRGGGGIYYDRIGGSPIADLARYQHASRELLQVSSRQQPLCYPIAACVDTNLLPPSLVELDPGIRTPYRVNYGLSIERQIGEKATITIGGRRNRGIALFRSIDVNAPLAQSDYTVRPNPNYSQIRQIQSEGLQDGTALDINYRGRFNRWFNAFAWYTWSHYDNNTSGITFFPQNQEAPDAEWGRADWDTRQRFGIFGQINPEHLLNLGFGVFAHSGSPYTITTGTDGYGDNLYNTRPDGVARNSETGPDYADLDLRWGYDFKLQPKEEDRSPTLGVSASAFNVLNEVNGSYIDSVQGSEDFNQVIAAYPARRIQLAMRFTF
jgi:outer membrane receptor protein involved in Fe transport